MPQAAGRSGWCFTAATVRRLSEHLLHPVRDRMLRLYPDPELEKELLRLQMVQTGYGGWRMDHRSGGFSDRAVALAMAALAASEHAAITLTPAAIDAMKQLIEGTRAPVGQRDRFSGLTGVPGMPNYGWRVD